MGRLEVRFYLIQKKSFKLIHIQPTNLPIQRCPLPCFLPLGFVPTVSRSPHRGRNTKRSRCSNLQHYSSFLRFGEIWHQRQAMCTYDLFPLPPPSLPVPVDFWRRFQTRQMAILVAETALKNAAFPLCAAVRPSVRPPASHCTRSGSESNLSFQ